MKTPKKNGSTTLEKYYPAGVELSFVFDYNNATRANAFIMKTEKK